MCTTHKGRYRSRNITSIAQPRKMGWPDAYVLQQPANRLDLFGLHEFRAAFAPPRVVQMIIRPMLLGVLRVLAVAARRAAHVVLLGQTPRPHRAEFAQLPLNLFDPFLQCFLVCLVHTDTIIEVSAPVNKKMRITAVRSFFKET
jgi:hypothetical protein